MVPPGVNCSPMQIDDDVRDDLLKRLRRVEGQVRGLQQMLVDGRECREIVTQLSAATKALEQVGFKLLAAGLVTCLADPEGAAEAGYPIDEVEKLFLKLA